MSKVTKYMSVRARGVLCRVVHEMLLGSLAETACNATICVSCFDELCLAYYGDYL